jgi:hypothetical protein
MKQLKYACIAIVIYVRPDLLLKHIDTTLETYKRRQINTKHASETHAKEHLKTHT